MVVLLGITTYFLDMNLTGIQSIRIGRLYADNLGW
jgi:hypothetical protein